MLMKLCEYYVTLRRKFRTFRACHKVDKNPLGQSDILVSDTNIQGRIVL